MIVILLEMDDVSFKCAGTVISPQRQRKEQFAMSKLEQLDSSSATAAPDEMVEPRIARAVEQASAPLVRNRGPEARQAQPAAPAVRASDTTPQDRFTGERAGLRNRSRLRMLVMIGGVFVVAATAGVIWLRGGRYVSTGDAYVQAAKLMVSTDVSGIVSSVDIHENQSVKAGDVLFRIDSRQFQIALDNAKANLAQTALTIESMKQDYKRMLSDVAAQQSQVELDQANDDRFATLVQSDVVSKANYDQARFTLAADKNKLESLRQQTAVQLARLAGNADIPETQHPQYVQAKAQVDEAQRQLDHAVVRAPFDGMVTQVDTLQPGTYLVSQTAELTNSGAVGLVSTEDVWVDPRLIMLLGFAMIAESMREMTGWTPDIDAWSLTLTTLLQGAGLGFVFIPLQVIAFATLPIELRTDGTALFSLVRNVGSSVGISITSALLAQNTQIVHAQLAEHVTPFNRLLQTGGAYLLWNNATPAGLGALNAEITRQASMIAYIDDFKFMLLICLPAAALLLLMRRPPALAAAADHPAIHSAQHLSNLRHTLV
jgi:membrane fusion protein (multidrug efflux system)